MRGVIRSYFPHDKKINVQNDLKERSIRTKILKGTGILGYARTWLRSKESNKYKINSNTIFEIISAHLNLHKNSENLRS